MDNKNVDCYMIIDEINRANLAYVFGELIYALEYRNESVLTPYSIEEDSEITIPENLYIIGTMNTADKSIGTIDYAIRRRFIFYPCLPDRKVVEDHYAGSDVALRNLAISLFDAVSSFFDQETGYLSTDYNADDVQVGHTYFLADSEEKRKSKFEYQVIPLLKEYYKDGVIEFTYDERKGKCATLIMKYLDNSLTLEDLDENTPIKDKNKKATLEQLIFKLQAEKSL